MQNFKTEQEAFWAGNFGNDYISRNDSKKLLAANLNMFSDVFCKTEGVATILELGANIGMNMLAINNLLPESKTSAVEINSTAFEQLKTVCTGEAFLTSILETQKLQNKYDLVFTKGVLIHINPEELNQVYATMHRLSQKYILVAEYYNPSPMMIKYRGEDNKLFKRDFAGEILDQYPDMKLVDYGFKYHRDNNYPQDDISWFLLEKTKSEAK
jgi:spore coat polysaccharide biosynthesis protein SpsF